jgi:hypothetical protein
MKQSCRLFKLTLSSPDEQEKIAFFLDHETAKIDTLIEKQQLLIKLLKEKRRAVISHAGTKVAEALQAKRILAIGLVVIFHGYRPKI